MIAWQNGGGQSWSKWYGIAVHNGQTCLTSYYIYTSLFVDCHYLAHKPKSSSNHTRAGVSTVSTCCKSIMISLSHTEWQGCWRDYSRKGEKISSKRDFMHKPLTATYHKLNWGKLLEKLIQIYQKGTARLNSVMCCSLIQIMEREREREKNTFRGSFSL